MDLYIAPLPLPPSSNAVPRATELYIKCFQANASCARVYTVFYMVLCVGRCYIQLSDGSWVKRHWMFKLLRVWLVGIVGRTLASKVTVLVCFYPVPLRMTKLLLLVIGYRKKAWQHEGCYPFQ